MAHNTKIYYGGYFDKEEDAAVSVNFLCDEFGIQRKNPTIMIEPDAIEQVNTLIIYCTRGESRNSSSILLKKKSFFFWVRCTKKS